MGSLKNGLTAFKIFNIIQIIDYLYTSYGTVDNTELDQNQVTMMTVYTPEMTMAILTNQLEESQSLAKSCKRYITYAIMISNGITLLKNTGIFPNAINEWNRKPDN